MPIPLVPLPTDPTGAGNYNCPTLVTGSVVSRYLLSLHGAGTSIDEQCDLQNPAALDGEGEVGAVEDGDQVPV